MNKKNPNQHRVISDMSNASRVQHRHQRTHPFSNFSNALTEKDTTDAAQFPPIDINYNDLSFDLAHFMEDTETYMLLLSQVTDARLCEGETHTIKKLAVTQKKSSPLIPTFYNCKFGSISVSEKSLNRNSFTESPERHSPQYGSPGGYASCAYRPKCYLFDTIDYAILLETLEKDLGATGNALKWLTSYLSERKQTILIKENESEVFNPQSGVPQGSCLGPVLLILYVVGLFKVIDKHLPNAHTYADDTQIYYSFRPDTSLLQDAAIKSIANCVADIRA
ncbi:Hypothetical predicted protein [Paramuricea clavata]|uniref:Uncharacterized protein n=1 Tax=Paramuricea clavata TaxID=317549 RepID=A0A6S7GE70_PARCT|nr:Hypothetical predicted protein [Paramuricea clavata]